MAMPMKDFLLLLLIFTGVTLGMGTFATELGVNYDVIMENSTTFDVSQRIFSDTKQIQDTLLSKPTGIPILDVGIVIAESAGDAIKLILVDTPDLWFQFINETGSKIFGLPVWVVALSTVALFLTFIFVVISAIIKWRVD